MKLYHFTAAHHLEGGPGHAGPGILNVGLLPNPHPWIALPAHVWLTEDDRFRQSWSTRPVPLPDGSTCDRTEVRLEVWVPRQSRDLLHGPTSIESAMSRPNWHDLTAFAHPWPWRVFFGTIPPHWIVGSRKRRSAAE